LPRLKLCAAAILLVTTCCSALRSASAQQNAASSGAIFGSIHDPLGALLPGARIALLDADKPVATASSGPEGDFRFALPAAGRYSLRVSAEGFQTTTTPQQYVAASSELEADVTLATATRTQQVTVTASGTPTPEAQTGAVVTLLPAADFGYMLEVQSPLRLAPGIQLTQAGQTGGKTGLSIRGGDTDANKVLIDGLPATQIGGTVEFENLASTGIGSIEVLSEPDSVLYGADAMAGVVHLTTTRAPATPLPLFTYAGDAGNFHTYRNDATASTVYRQFDLFSEFARIQTSNNIPNSEFHNATYAGNFGWAPNAANDLRVIVRHIDVTGGQPNAIALYGIPDDAQQQERDLYLSGSWNNQATARWHNLVRYGYVRLHGQYNDFAATGILDPNTGYYDGAPVTITGANGYSVSGQALFQYTDGAPPYLEHNSDSSIYAQTDYRLNSHLLALGALRYESEKGASYDQGTVPSPIDRGNYDYSFEFSGDLANRVFYTVGTGLEKNGLYGFAGTPRASLAWYPFRPSNSGTFSGTKLHGTFGKGIKEPSVYQQQYALLGQITAAQAAQLNVSPLGPEDSRSFDAGVEQQILNGRARLGLTWFHDEFTNRVEYLPPSELILLGIAGASLPAVAANYGAYVNSSAFRSQGLEFTAELKLASSLFARGGYTYTDAVIQRSFSSDNLSPVFNTSFNFPTIQIGQFSPLVGARPFRVAPHTGFFALEYQQSRFNAALTGTLVGRRDDSDFLSDSDFGYSLLLPNRNLDGAYQRLELGGGYQATSRINVYANIQNLLSEHYNEAFGYPALPFTFRSGVKFNFGGESWKLK
jgi:iron complex outermembrane receptor protein/vitamin B12 transporter